MSGASVLLEKHFRICAKGTDLEDVSCVEYALVIRFGHETGQAGMTHKTRGGPVRGAREL